MENTTIAGGKRAIQLAAARAKTTPKDRLSGKLLHIRTWIDKKTWSEEPSLQQTAWPQYRYMDPLERTELFTKAYFDAYVRAYQKYFPDADASKKRPIDPEFVRNELSVMNALWTARAHADAIGVPYDFYLDTVMEAHLANDKWHRPPRPNQLYGKLAPIRAGSFPSAEVAKRLYGPDWDPRFQAANYNGHPAQDAAIHLLKGVVEQAANPAAVLASYLCDRKCVPVDVAESVFGPQAVEAALNLSTELPVQTGKTPRTAHLLACLGFPNPQEDSPCAVCLINSQCLKISALVRDDLIRTTGSDDPRAAWKKQAAKERQRRHRKHKKEENLGLQMTALFDENNPDPQC